MENSAVGTTNGKSIVSSIGLVVSMVELAVATKPVDWSSDGEDMLGVLPGNQNKPRTSALFWRRRSPPGRTATLEDPNRDLAMRDGRWKWLCKLNGSETQFYDVSSDISETTNLVQRHLDVAARLESVLLAWNVTLPVEGVSSFRPRQHCLAANVIMTTSMNSTLHDVDGVVEERG
ncbi:MAG: hypothetical protein P8L37_08705, partial [Phycisphaerales bacterium]|nr:hypothetical protein [Phycisphaerales bacterium]